MLLLDRANLDQFIIRRVEAEVKVVTKRIEWRKKSYSYRGKQKNSVLIYRIYV